MEITMSDDSHPYAGCPLYLPGHNVHFIQLRLTWNEPEHDPIPATLLEVHDDGELTLDVDGELRWYWNHRPDDVAWAMTRYDGEFELVGYGVLAVARRLWHDGQGMPAFYITEPDSEYRRPCPDQDDPVPADPIERLMKTGGFVMSGPEALRWAELRERGAR
jgi:hypothetical protein